MDGLTPLQRRFCLEYIKDKNGKKAAVRAGYSKRGAAVEAVRQLRNKEIRDFIRSAIADQESRIQVDGDKVIKELCRIAFFDPVVLQKLATEELVMDDLTRDERAAILEIQRDVHTWSEKDGDEEHREVKIKVKAQSKIRALEILAKHFNLFKESETDLEKVFKLAYSLKDEK